MAGFWLIPDGFTFTGKIEGTPGSLRSARFQYRLCPPVETARVNMARTPEAVVELKADIVAKYTSNWEIQNDDKSWAPVAVIAEDLLALPASILEIAYAHVINTIGPNLEKEAGKSPAASG